MIESESEAIRQMVKQGILNIQPLLVSIVETSSEHNIMYAIVSDV